MDQGQDVQGPPADGSEAEMLLYALERSRRTFAWKCSGLGAEELRQPLPPSTLTLGGLLKHLALVEDQYAAIAFDGEPLGEPWDGVAAGEWPDWEWRSAADDSPEELLQLWRRGVDRSRRAVARLLAGGTLDQPTRMEEGDGRPVNARRVLVDLHEEYARHVGHADLLREAIDGLVGEDAPPGAG
jgi:hypothetical protein